MVQRVFCKFKDSRIGDIKLWFLISVLLGIVFLLVYVFFIKGAFGSGYEISLVECNQFMSNVDGKPVFFGELLDKPNSHFLKGVEGVCPSKSVKVGSSSLKGAADLISDCFSKFGSGEDFLGKHMKDSGLVIYCGEVSGEYEDFGKKLFDRLSLPDYDSLRSKDFETKNFNEEFLFSVLKEGNLVLNKKNSVDVFYYIYKPYKQENFLRVAEEFWEVSVTPTIVDYILPRENPSMIAVVLKQKDEGLSDKSLDDFKGKASIYGLNVVIPEKNYD